MNQYDARERKLRQIKARRKRAVRIQKIILSMSLAVIVCLTGGVKYLIDQNVADSAAPRAPRTAVSDVRMLSDAGTTLKKAAAVALKNSTTKTIAHRGFSSQAPENTLAAFDLAARSGTWGIETDVCRTRDGEYICMHDGSMDRMTNIGGAVAALTFSQISGAVIDSGFGIASYPNEKVPTLREYLELCSQYGINAVLDLKFTDPSYLDDMVQIVKDTGMEGASIALTSKPALMRRIRELGCTMQVQYLMDTATAAKIDEAASIARSGIAASKITPELIGYAQEKGLMINVWTYNKQKEKDYWKDLKVDYVTSDIVS